VVSNDLNKAILGKLIELKIVDPSPVPQLRVLGLENPSIAERMPRRPTDAAASS
jgi:hypothetical protein